MKKLMTAMAVGLIAAASYACCNCNCGKQTNTASAPQEGTVTNNVCACHIVKTCCCCSGNCCNPRESGCEYSCGNNWFGVKVSVTRWDNPPPVPPPMAQMQPQQMPPSAPQQGSQPQQSQPVQQQPMLQNTMYAPVVPIYQTWVEGKYMTGVLQDGRVVKTWVPGHYENCQIIGQ